MELPIEIQRIINDYARPITRPDWRKGCYFCRMVYSLNDSVHIAIIYDVRKRYD
jgi:hypothetical protein